MVAPAGFEESARHGSGWPSGGRAGCEKTPKRAAPTSARRRAAVAGTRAPAKRIAAIPASAFNELRGRSKTAIGTARKMSCQRFQCGSWARLSPPISQTNRVCGKRRRSAFSVSAVYVEPSSASMPLARMRRSAEATASACCSRSANGAMPARGFSGFCGDTSHHTSSRSSRRNAKRLICRCPPCAGLNDPPRRPMRRPLVRPVVVRGAPGRCRARGICMSSARPHRPARAAAAAGSRCRSRRPCRIRRRRRTGSRR